MKKIVFIILMFILSILIYESFCQRKIYPADNDTAFNTGSNIVFPELDNRIITNLDLLGKLWGFLKYHHPEIGKGNYNWDYELFRILPEYLKVIDEKQRDRLLLDWINRYGLIPVCSTCKKTTANAFLRPDLSWIKKYHVCKELENKVKEIYKNRYQREQYYISMNFYHYPNFLHENPYSNMPYPDQGFRLLALYRYWNIIQYFFPYRHLTNKDWSTSLKEYIPKFINAKDELEYELTCTQLMGEINDSHAGILIGDKIIQSRGDKYAPFRVQFIENKFIVTDFYNPELQSNVKLQIGDIITHIEGKPIEKIIDSIRVYYPASNEVARMRDIAFNLLRSNLQSIEIQFISDDEKKKTILTLYEKDSLKIYGWFKENNEKCYKILHENISYISLGSTKKDDIPIIKKIIKNKEKIIIDIRNGVSPDSYLLDQYFFIENTPYVTVTLGNLTNPGEFTFSKPYSTPNSNEYYQGKLVVLVNEYTQSGSEWRAMLFKVAPNATIIGSTTAGTNGNVSIINLPGDIQTYISGIGVYYPDGTETQRVGIVPDIDVKPTIEGIKSGRDEVLEKAIEIINQQ
ncbi:MAG: peptidase S41 [Bacteroidales bacterium]|nr:peptidase S41 [Bacteroidales bacterium]